MSLRREPVLTERRKKILGAVVDLHVKTAQPVSSKAVVLEYRLNISPATVRLEFGVLEQMGLIFQPHTSAGRVPSDSGYRVFVDKVLSIRPLPPYRLRLWEQKLAHRYGEVRDLLQAACRLLSQCTDYASWAILPCRDTEVVRGVHFSLLPDHRVVAMLLGHRLIYKAFLVSESFEPTQWQQAANWLNNRLNRVPLSTLLQTDWSHWETLETSHNPVFPLAFKLVQKLAEEVWQSEVWMEGLSRLLAEPEFQSLERAQHLIAFWETPHKLAVLCEAFMSKVSSLVPKAWVAIGSEIPLAKLCDCSIVAAPCFASDYPFGMIGILGPKRMRYPDAIPAVEGIATLASQALTSMLS
jgi:heat-inducible transcriptional repressor